MWRISSQDAIKVKSQIVKNKMAEINHDCPRIQSCFASISECAESENKVRWEGLKYVLALQMSMKLQVQKWCHSQNNIQWNNHLWTILGQNSSYLHYPRSQYYLQCKFNDFQTWPLLYHPFLIFLFTVRNVMNLAQTFQNQRNSAYSDLHIKQF